MAKIHHRKAQKNYPDNGISKGDMYYYVNIKTGPRSSRIIRSLTKPLPEHLTSSPYLQTWYPLTRQLGEFDGDKDDLQNIHTEFEGLQEEEQGKFDNMPSGLQMGDTGALIEDRIAECQSIVDQIDPYLQEDELSKEQIDEIKAIEA